MDEEKIKRHIFGDGYGKPPKETQSKKGQSGNPKGRPKKAQSDLPMNDHRVMSAVLRVANKKVSVRDGSETTEISMLEAVLAATAACAVKGNARSQATFIGLAQKAHEIEALQRRQSIERWSEYKQIWSSRIEEAKKRDQPVPNILPHPDDIIIDHTQGVRFIGPIDKEEEAQINETIFLRDTLIMQDELDHRTTIRIDGELLNEPGSASLLSFILDRGIPPRLQLSDTERLLKMSKYQSMPKRELLRRLYRS